MSRFSEPAYGALSLRLGPYLVCDADNLLLSASALPAFPAEAGPPQESTPGPRRPDPHTGFGMLSQCLYTSGALYQSFPSAGSFGISGVLFTVLEGAELRRPV